MSLTTTSVFILATASLHREAWQALLYNQPYIHVGGSAGTTEHLAALVTLDQPTTVLIDVPDGHATVLHQLNTSYPTCGRLLLVQSYDLTQIMPLLQAGATGCISRDEPVSDLTRAIIATGRGEIVLPSNVATQALTALADTTRLLAALSHPQPVGETGAEALSERELEIVYLLGQGLTNKDIAQTLIISVRTVEAHLRNLYDKLGVHSRTEAALWAVKHDYGQRSR